MLQRGNVLIYKTQQTVSTVDQLVVLQRDNVLIYKNTTYFQQSLGALGLQVGISSGTPIASAQHVIEPRLNTGCLVAIAVYSDVE